MQTAYERRKKTKRRVSALPEEQPGRFLKTFSRQLLIASLCLILVYFTGGIEHPAVKQIREAVRYATNYEIDFAWIQNSVSGFLESWMGTKQPDSGPAPSPEHPAIPNPEDQSNSPAPTEVQPANAQQETQTTLQ